MKRATILVAVLILVLSACDSGTEDTTGSGSSEASISVGIVEPFGLDPAIVGDNQAIQVARLLYDGLVGLDENLEVVPAVAESWDNDGTVWTFHLRDDATFTNGRTVNASDFVYAWNRAANPDTASQTAYQGLPIAGWGEVMDGAATEIAGVRAVDDQTLEVTTVEPFALLPKVLTHPVFSPVPAEEIDTPEKAAAFAEQPIGNGRYVMSGPWEHNVSIPLVRNEDYYGTPGNPAEIEFRIYSGAEPMYRDVQAGNLDIGFQAVTPALRSSAESDFGDRLLSVSTGSVQFLDLPTTAAPYDNPDIARALSMAIDREAIASQIHQGSVTPAKGLVPPQAPGAVADACGGYCDYDPDGAKELFDAAGGIPDGRILLYFQAGAGADDEVEVIANGWRTALGVEVELASDEFAPFLDTLYSGVDDRIFYTGWLWDYPSAYSFLSPLLESTSLDNIGPWVNAEFDAKLAEARSASSEEAGLPALEDAQRIAGSELPLIPVYFPNDESVYVERIGNLSEGADGSLRLENVTVSD